MNIFVLETDPKICAQYHCDKHVVKMIVESCQMLSTCLNEFGVETMMKPCYKNHPCTVWARKTKANYLWLCDLCMNLCVEYNFRYGKVHSLQDYTLWLMRMVYVIPDGELTPFAQAMPIQHKCNDAVKAYRKYYTTDKKSILHYTRRLNPEWL